MLGNKKMKLREGHYYKSMIGTVPLYFKVIDCPYGGYYTAQLSFKKFAFDTGSFFEKHSIEISILEGLREVGK